MTAGSRVHHDAGVAAAFHPIDNLEEGHEFIQARQRQAEKAANVLLIEKRTGGRNLVQFLAVLSPKSSQALLRIQLEDGQVGGRHHASQTVPERVRRVGRDQQKGFRGPLRRKQQGRRCGAGGLANPSLASEQQ